jgi:nucleoside-diphosphate-sugar epimerase
MIVFVTGGTGALGVPTISLLRRRGHRVRALATGAASAAALRGAGAEPVEVSLFDRDALASAVRGADAILHLATRIAPASAARRREAWRDNDRIRTEGTRNLVDAALTAGVGVLVYPSFAPVYADGGSRWLSYGSPVAPTDVLRSTLTAEEEVARFTAAGGRGVVLRLAGVYGPHSSATRDVLAMAHKGVSAFVGPAGAYQPLLWDEDAAAALLAAVETPGLRGVYDVADDEPLTRAQLATAVAEVVGRRSVRRPPTALVRLAFGGRLDFLLRSQRVSNQRFKEATGWSPRVRDAAAGLRRLRSLGAVGRARPARPETGTGVRVLVAFLALVTVAGGLWQGFWPESFFTDFPGFGRHWVDVDGPFNEHLMRDYGFANLGIGLAALYAALRPSRATLRAVALALAVPAVPHLVYHVVHVDALPATVDRVAQTLSLGTTAVLAVLLFALAFRPAPAPARGEAGAAAGGAADSPAGGFPAADGTDDPVATVTR